MAIVEESQDSRSGGGTRDGTSWPVTVDAAATLAVLNIAALTSSSTPTAMTLGGQSMTKLWEIATGTRLSQCWYLVSPPTGAQSYVFTQPAAHTRAVNLHRDYSGNDLTTPFGAAQTAVATDDTPTVDVTGTQSGELVIDGMGSDTAGTITVGGGQTVDLNVKDVNTVLAASSEGGGGTVTMSWSNTLSTDAWAIGAAAIKLAVVPDAFVKVLIKPA